MSPSRREGRQGLTPLAPVEANPFFSERKARREAGQYTLEGMLSKDS
jgi:hypothetical protein